jgi:hypothetical protein
VRFLPERLRPPVVGRRRKRGVALLTVVPVILLVLPRWQVERVVVEGCPMLPATAVRSLHELVGQPALGLDLETVRDRVDVWPGVGEVEVELELPGTVRVRARAATSLGSVRIGRSWHGVASDGSLAGVVEVGLPPVLEGFTDHSERSDGLAVAGRLESATGCRVLEVRRVTPQDYRLRIEPAGSGPEFVVHALPQGSDGERAWCAAVVRGDSIQPWADLRWSDRIVVGSGS